ncbi:MAG: C39 family peptidase [Anaerolineae bacterium]|nr:C39 family peptidase [Anaerolineae bacterium]
MPDLGVTGVTICRMRFRKTILPLVILAILAVLLYQIPAVNTRLEWRVELARVYLRGLFTPAGSLPAPIPTAAAQVTATVPPTQTVTPTPPGPTPTSIPSATPLPQMVNLTPPKWVKQDINNCGPTTLSLYLNYYGWRGDQFEIANEIKPERLDKNVNVEELIYFSRNWAGWLQSNFRVGGDIQLLKTFLAAGFPIMVEEGYALERGYWIDDDQWAGHYLLLTGYDDAAQVFITQDTYVGPNELVSYDKLDEGWKAFNRVYFILYLPSQEEAVKSILGPHWDSDFNRQAAMETAQAEAAANPQDAFAWFNVGSNLVYFERYGEAAAAFDQARQIGLPQRMLRYQFGPFISYFHTLRTADLLALTEYALEITDNSEEALLWHGWGLYRLGNSAGAIEYFREAYWANPKSQDAAYALDFMGASP